MDVETIRTIQGYAYFFMTAILVVILYSYIYYLYSSEKKGEKDFEKFSQIALDDNIDSTPIQEKSPWEEKKEEKKKEDK